MWMRNAPWMAASSARPTQHVFALCQRIQTSTASWTQRTPLGPAPSLRSTRKMISKAVSRMGPLRTPPRPGRPPRRAPRTRRRPRRRRRRRRRTPRRRRRRPRAPRRPPRRARPRRRRPPRRRMRAAAGRPCCPTRRTKVIAMGSGHLMGRASLLALPAIPGSPSRTSATTIWRGSSEMALIAQAQRPRLP